MTNRQIPQNVNQISTDGAQPAGIGHNGPPEKFTLSAMRERRRAIYRRSDLTERQKLMFAIITDEAGRDGIAELSTRELMELSSIKDRGTVLAGTRVLRDRDLLEKASSNGQSGRYKPTMTSAQLQKITGELEQMKTSRVEPYRSETITGVVEPDRSEIKPDRLDHTGMVEPVGLDHTGTVEPDRSDLSPSCARAVDNNITKTNTNQHTDRGEDRGSGGKENPEEETTPGAALEAFRLYNELAQRIGLPIAKTLTPGRRKAMMARMREHGGIAAWKTALDHVERSKFLRGGGDRGWRADLDFLCQAKSFTRTVEGGFGNGAHAVNDIQSFEARGREVYAEVQRKKQEAKQWTR